MRQVPNYGIIGDGKMARHFCHYLSLLKISYQQWSRTADPNYQHFENFIQHCNPILILISDAAIEDFIVNHPNLKTKTLIHFSGRLVSGLAYGAHPLMTFSHSFYPLTTYQKIPFILENKAPPFSELLPGLNNPAFAINPELKAFYHALCVLSGNFTVLLWQKFFKELTTTFQIPKSMIYPYLEQTLLNLQENDQHALTGPLARGDQATIQANLQALKNDPFQKIYQAFLETFLAEKKL